MSLTVFVLYRPTTSDYPGEWVVRRQRPEGLAIYSDRELSARGRTQAACVEELVRRHPEVLQLSYLPRMPGDDPVIEGVWL